MRYIKYILLIIIVNQSYAQARQQPFHWPISSSSLADSSDIITSPFGPRAVNGYQIHYGMDLRADYGRDAKAPTNGIITDIEYAGGSTGWVLTFEFVNPRNNEIEYLLYFHSNDDPANKYWQIGETVPLGHTIYEVGDGDGAFAPHLHVSYNHEDY